MAGKRIAVVVTAEFVDIETGERRRPGTVMEVAAERAARMFERGLAKPAPEPTPEEGSSEPGEQPEKKAAKPESSKRR